MEAKTVVTCVFCLVWSSGKQQIYNQIQQRLEDQQVQDELKEKEKHQIRDKQEKMNLEDQKVWQILSEELSCNTYEFLECLLDCLSCSRILRRKERNNSSCSRRSCASMLRPWGLRSRGERRRSWPTWETRSTSRTNWSDRKQMTSTDIPLNH